MQTQTTPARRRSISAAAAPKVTEDMKALALTFHKQNVIANAAKNAAKKAREQLLAVMNDAGVIKFDFTGGGCTLDVKIEAKEAEAIDVTKLRALVNDATFMQCVSAAKGRVEEVAGSAIVAQTAVSVKGEPNVTVKPKK
jgi:hypothetical protein